VDIDPKTYNMDPSLIKEKITDKTKAILPVHIFGQSCDMDPIVEIAEKHDLKIVEDACESLGAKYKNKMVGTFGLASVFAFYPNKQMTTGEGGIIATSDNETADLCKSLRNQGRDDSGEWLNHVRVGYNYRMDEMSCALGIVQLGKLDYMIKKRQEIADMYNKNLSKIDGVITPYTSDYSTHTWFLYTIRFKEGIDRNKIMDYLNAHGVACKPYFPALHLQPIYKEILDYKEGDFQVTEEVSNSILALPIFTEMDESMVLKVCSTIEEAVGEVK
jgi:perosamine synthetase